MPPTRDHNTKQAFTRSFSNNGTSMSASVYQPASNLMPASPPPSPIGQAPRFPPAPSSWGRQNSTNGKYS